MQTSFNPECTPPAKTHSWFHKSESAPVTQRKLRQEDQADLQQETLSVPLSKSEAPPLSGTQSEEKCPHALGFAGSAPVPAPNPPGFQPREPFHRGARRLLPAQVSAFMAPSRGSTRVPARSHRVRQPYSGLGSPAVPGARLLSRCLRPQPHKGLGAFQPRPEGSGVNPGRGPSPKSGIRYLVPPLPLCSIRR